MKKICIKWLINETIQKYKYRCIPLLSLLPLLVLLFSVLILAYKHCDRSHQLSAQRLVSTRILFSTWLGNALTWQKLLSQRRPSEKMKGPKWWQCGSSVLHMHAPWRIAVIWKYAHFRPDDIRQAPHSENYAWGILASVTHSNKMKSSLIHLLVCSEPRQSLICY